MGRRPKIDVSPATLHRLYVIEELTLAAVGERLGVSGQWVQEALIRAGIPRRAAKRTPAKRCRCGTSVVKVKSNGKGYRSGTRCRKCWNAYTAAQTQAKNLRLTAEERAHKRTTEQRWRMSGATTPTKEIQWLRKARQLARTARRVIRSGDPRPPAARSSPPTAFAPPRTSRNSSRF